MARIPLEAIWIDMAHHHFRFELMSVPVEFVKADGAAVQLMDAVEILINFIMLSVQVEAALSNAVADATNRSAEIGIRFWTIAFWWNDT